MLDRGPFRTIFTLQGVPESNNFADGPSGITQLEQCLLPQQPRSRQNQRRKVFVLYRLGSIGKTQLASEFARRHRPLSARSSGWTAGRRTG